MYLATFRETIKVWVSIKDAAKSISHKFYKEKILSSKHTKKLKEYIIVLSFIWINNLSSKKMGISKANESSILIFGPLIDILDFC